MVFIIVKNLLPIISIMITNCEKRTTRESFSNIGGKISASFSNFPDWRIWSFVNLNFLKISGHLGLGWGWGEIGMTYRIDFILSHKVWISKSDMTSRSSKIYSTFPSFLYSFWQRIRAILRILSFVKMFRCNSGWFDT